MAEEKEKKEDKETKGYELVEVPTKMGLAIRSPEGEALGIDEALVHILNKLDELNRKI